MDWKKMYQTCRAEKKVLKAENEAKTKVNMFLSLQWKELKTSQNLAEMTGLGLETGTDVAIVHIASDFIKLKEENKKLKKYESMIHCIWGDLYWADKGGCEVSFDDVSNSCDYYENEEFVKKEVVDDDDV